MEKLGIILAFFTLPNCLCAQEILCAKDQEALDKAISTAVQKRAKDQVAQDFYTGVITSAFEEYLNNKNCLSSFRTNTQNDLRESIADLKKQKKELAKQQENLQKTSKQDAGESARKKEELRQLKEDKKNIEQSIENIQREIDEANKSLAELEPTMKMIEKSENKINDLKEGFKAVAQKLSELKTDGSLLNNDAYWNKVSTALETFNGKRSSMRNVEPDLEEESSKQAALLSDYKNLVDILQQSITQMGKKFDSKKNIELASAINKCKANITLTTQQEEECKTVSTALEKQGETYQYVRNLLKAIIDSKDGFGVLSDKEMMDEFKRWKEKKLKNDQYTTRYQNRYYKTINVVLEKLNSLGYTSTQQALTNQINNLIGEL